MARTGGRKLSTEAREFLKELVISGYNNAQILARMAAAGHPADLSLNTLSTYRKDPGVVKAIDAVTSERRQYGMANRANRIDRLEDALNDLYHRRKGTLPSDADPTLPDATPRVVVGSDTYRKLFLAELRGFIELDRLASPQVTTITRRDEAGNVTGTTEISGPVVSQISEQERFNDMLQRFIEREYGKSIEEIEAEAP